MGIFVSRNSATMSKDKITLAPRRSARNNKTFTATHDDESLDELADSNDGRDNRMATNSGNTKSTPQIPKNKEQKSRQSERQKPVVATSSIEARNHGSDEEAEAENTSATRTNRKQDLGQSRDLVNMPAKNEDVSIGNSDETKSLRAQNTALRNQLEEKEARLNWYREKVNSMEPTNAWPATEDTEME